MCTSQRVETFSTSLNISLIEAGHRTLREDHREKKHTARVLAAQPATVSGWSQGRLKQGPVRHEAARAQPSVLTAALLRPGGRDKPDRVSVSWMRR